jgi:hypothetical protein
MITSDTPTASLLQAGFRQAAVGPAAPARRCTSESSWSNRVFVATPKIFFIYAAGAGRDLGRWKHTQTPSRRDHKMPQVFAIVAISLVSLQYCSALQVYQSHSTMATGFIIGEQSLPFAVWSTRTSARTPSYNRCIHDYLTHSTVGSVETAKRKYHQFPIAGLKSRIVSMSKHRDNKLPLFSFASFNPTKRSAPRLTVASLALFTFFLCLASKSAFAADVLASPYQQLLAGGVSSPLRYFSNFLPAGRSPCPQQ